jgi:hypothetical protein
MMMNKKNGLNSIRIIRKIFFLVLLIILNNNLYSQEYKKIENVEVVNLLDLIFKYADEKNINGFREIISEEFYCIFCDAKVNYDKPYIYSKEDFIIKYLNDILNLDIFSNAYHSKKISIEDTSDDEYNRADLIIHFTVYEANELIEDNEGGLLGIYLKKENGNLKFSGLETIP